MKKSTKNFILIIFLIFGSFDFYNKDSEWSVTGNVIRSFNPDHGIKIANWNLQIFGTKKADNQLLMNSYAEKIKGYDIIFVQEIRDSSDTAFNKLCLMLPGYNCEISSRAGRSSSKEQYGIIYNNTIKLNFIKDFNPDSLDRWERPPIEAGFNLGAYNITIFNIHIKPDDVKNELNYLDDVALNTGNTLVFGDLNMDCTYYDHSKENEFSNWSFIIKDTDDTTSGPSNCAYDRIILSDELNNKFIKYGIDTDVNKEQSDHYLVWFEIKSE